MNPPLTLHRRGELAAVRERALRTRRVRSVEVASPTRIGLWLPLTPLFWLLAPFALLLSPLLLLAPPFRGANPFVAAAIVGQVLISLSGTEVDVDTHDVRIRIRIF